MEKTEWIRCPVCGNKTRLQIRADTELKNFPLYCPKCRQESLIDVKDLQVTIIKEPDAQTQSRWTCNYTLEGKQSFIKDQIRSKNDKFIRISQLCCR